MAAQKNDRTFWKWLSQPEAMIGLSAVVVSLIAVAVSTYEARIMREWQQAAVWPYIQLSRSAFYDREELEATGETTWTVTLNAENVGVGPARIKDFHVFVDGEPHLTWSSAIQAVLDSDDAITYGQSSINGAILPAERSVQMFRLSDKVLAKRIYENMDGLDFSACYCSVFDQCWITRYGEYGDAEPVASCERDENSFEE